MKNDERKRLAVILNVLLLLWYALSMFGVRIGEGYLVEGAFRDEWLFLLIPTLTFILYLSLGKSAPARPCGQQKDNSISVFLQM